MENSIEEKYLKYLDEFCPQGFDYFGKVWRITEFIIRNYCRSFSRKDLYQLINIISINRDSTSMKEYKEFYEWFVNLTEQELRSILTLLRLGK
jgi:hypothetical protein